jgi:hypothetical protein
MARRRRRKYLPETERAMSADLAFALAAIVAMIYVLHETKRWLDL